MSSVCHEVSLTLLEHKLSAISPADKPGRANSTVCNQLFSLLQPPSLSVCVCASGGYFIFHHFSFFCLNRCNTTVLHSLPLMDYTLLVFFKTLNWSSTTPPDSHPKQQTHNSDYFHVCLRYLLFVFTAVLPSWPPVCVASASTSALTTCELLGMPRQWRL